MSDTNEQKPQDQLSDEERKIIEEFADRVIKFDKFADRVGIKKECLACGSKKGRIFLGFREEYPVIPVSTLGKYYPAYALACPDCGFVSSHLANLVDAKITESENDE